MTESTVKLKLSVWRAFQPKSPIYSRRTDDGPHTHTLDQNLQEEVYAWHLREDPFAGVVDEKVREEIRTCLVEQFSQDKPVSERRVESISIFLRQVEAALATAQVEWVGSHDVRAEEEESPYRLNVLLALRLHLEWIFSIYKDQPNVSILIR